MACILRTAVLAAVVLGSSAYLRAAPAKATGAKGGNATAAKNSTEADVQRVRAKLTTMATALEGMLDQKTGTLSKLKVATPMQTFVKELKVTLSDTKDMKDTKQAMKRLNDAQAGVKSLLKDMTSQQESLMKEDEEQKESLLLGVLMTKQKEPMDKQLEIIKSPDFASLAVVKALLEKHDDKIPLFAQVGDWLDSKGKHVKAETPEDKKKAVLASVQTIAASLEKRVQVLEKAEKEGVARHKKVIAELEKKEKAAKKQDATHLKRIQKREERQFKKWFAMSHQDLTSMKKAVVAVKKGDMKELQNVMGAIKQSLKAMQSQNGGFLHFIQLGHKTYRRDCPYCAAQCLDKCHSGGGSYGTCLTQCADAGKGF